VKNLFLPDINTILALLDQRHVHHQDAHRWFEKKSSAGFLICPHVENGVIRIASQPRYPNCLGTTAAARAVLIQFVAEMGMERCRMDTSLLDDKILLSPSLLTPAAVADLYLLAVAATNGAKLATFDKRIQPSAIQGGKVAIELIPTS
jgi:toxin-antitoxin system PIN domain toxin